MVELNKPFTSKQMQNLKLGEQVKITGTIFTIRDMACKYLFEGKKLPINLDNSIIFHCGPIVKNEKDTWKVIAAGPTTSARQEPYEWKLIENFQLKGIIGKGGMGEKTIKACEQFGCVYLSAIGGIGTLLAKHITKVNNVYMLDEFGQAEAIWEFEVKDFPTIVTIDAHGNSLHKEVENESGKDLRNLTQI